MSTAAAKVNFVNIPQELKANASFCVWRYEKRNGTKTKVPYNPRTRALARVNDPSTFADFASAMKTYAMGGWDGIGFNECIKLQEIQNGTGGVLYVTATHAQLPWEFHVWESVVSSAWLYLIIKNPDVLFPKTLRQVYYMARIISNERP